MSKPQRLFFLIAVVVTLMIPLASRAQDTTNGCGSIPFIPAITIPGTVFVGGQTTTVDCRSLGVYMSQIYTFAVYAGSLAAAIILMVGGFMWLTAGGNVNQTGTARTYIAGALSGFILLLLSWVLLNTINPNLVQIKALNIKSIPHEDVPAADIQPLQTHCVCHGASGSVICANQSSAPSSVGGICVCNGDPSSATSSPDQTTCEQNSGCVFQSTRMSGITDASTCQQAAGSADAPYTCSIESGSTQQDVANCNYSKNAATNTSCTGDICASGLTCNRAVSCLVGKSPTTKLNVANVDNDPGCCVALEPTGGPCYQDSDCQSGSCPYSWGSYITQVSTCK